MKKFIKRHRYTIILVLIFSLLVVLGLKVKEILVPDEGKATYGERLRDINKHPINEEIYSKISKEYGENKNVKNIKYRLQGRIINYFITVDDKLSLKDAKSLGDKLVTYFDEDSLSYYSIQIYVIKEDEAQNNFPIIGFKSPKAKNVSWTKDREITKSDEDEE